MGSQGRFKEPVPLGAVLTGQKFTRPLRNLPPGWLLRALCRVARRLSPSLVISEHSLLSPAAASAQVGLPARSRAGHVPVASVARCGLLSARATPLSGASHPCVVGRDNRDSTEQGCFRRRCMSLRPGRSLR